MHPSVLYSQTINSEESHLTQVLENQSPKFWLEYDIDLTHTFDDAFGGYEGLELVLNGMHPVGDQYDVVVHPSSDERGWPTAKFRFQTWEAFREFTTQLGLVADV
jgi:hypothetical protein